jgi:BMFP domain-containing protein YqiC
MNRSEFGDLFNRIMEDMERLIDSMPKESKEHRHVRVAMNELTKMAEWLGLPLITKEEFESQRRGKKPQLRSVK